MTTRINLVVGLLSGLLAGNALAQDSDAADAARAESERLAASQAADDAERERSRSAAVRSMEEEMRAAEARLEEAARRIAELSSQRLPNFTSERFEFHFGGRPMLGISIEGDSGDGPVEGVVVRGVSPGGAAFEAGLRSGDTLTAINDESLAADSSADANRKLLDFMQGVEEGDVLDIEYLRDGDVASVDVTPQASMAQRFGFLTAPGAPRAPSAPRAPGVPVMPSAPGAPSVLFWRGSAAWADLEMVALSEDLGRYFGTDKGLLVVRAPADGGLELRDGDVIKTIGGREPESVSHAVRILASYQPGETLAIEILRDQRQRTLEVEMPDNRQSQLALPDAHTVIDLRREVEKLR